MADLVVRPANIADVAVLHELAERTFPLACPPGTTHANTQAFIDTQLSEEAFRGYLRDQRYSAWIAYVDQTPVGYALAATGEPEPQIAPLVSRRPTLELSKIYVVAEAQGTGVSSALLAEVESLGRSVGAQSIWLGVNQFNERANRFYLRNGFEVVGTRRFQVGDSVEPDYVREKVLD